uniref:Uncharacterized protein n=1 Tax=Aegilops tauschii subsp. strangulata TaxID=200361 RepID=A0A453LYS9_AEGTS
MDRQFQWMASSKPSASPRNRSSISSAVSIQFPLLTKTGMEPSMPFTYLSLSMIKATLSADLTIPFCCMKEGCPLSVFPRPMTAASVPSSITSASAKAKSIWAPSSWLPTFIPAFSASLAQITDLADQPQQPIRRN